MQALAPGITINGVRISPEEINSETQYHPAPSLFDAKYEAMRALVIRELLLQRAVETGIPVSRDDTKNLDEAIATLLDQDITAPQADEETCRRYYNNNKEKFSSSPLYEVSHILYMAPPEDEKAFQEAKNKAQAALEKIIQSPDLFEKIARSESACPSAKDGGRLGQIGKGQTMPEFEDALFKMCEGELCAQPVTTSVGYHLIKVHNRAEGRQIPFESVSNRIREYLEEQSWNRAFQQYIRLLASRAKISGFHFEGTTKSPLVQ